MKLQIVNVNPKYSPVKLIEPTTVGSIHLAAVVQPRPASFMPMGREKTQLLARCRCNYRDLLWQLQPLVEQQATNAPTSPQTLEKQDTENEQTMARLKRAIDNDPRSQYT